MFMAFLGADHYANGGMFDHLDNFSSLADAVEQIKREATKTDIYYEGDPWKNQWAHVYDTDICKIVWEHSDDKEPALRTWDLWVEGYEATGQRRGAKFCGKFKGASLKDAVIAYRDSLNPTAAAYISVDGMTEWGCRFFDNEADARKAFG